MTCAGTCSQCGEAEAVPGRRMCSSCLAYQRVVRAQRREAGLCGNCGREARPGKKTCQLCADKQATMYQARRDRRRAAGQCYSCGRPSDAFRCPRCAERVARAWSKRKGKPLLASVSTTLLCAVEHCGNPPQPGRPECASCIAARLAQQPAQNDQAALTTGDAW